jgi:type IV secretory pathway TrbL component
MGLPIGSIILWKRTAAEIPLGWQVCNGTNGTPDLRDYFVYGASVDGDVGTTGDGSHSHTIPANTSSNGTHTHPMTAGVANTSQNITDGKDADGSGVDRASASHGHSGISGTTGSDPDHSHTAGGSVANNTVVPPYIKLYYIMRVV